jgi:hypothetical protein
MVMFCTSCGTANPPDARFCAKCGSAVGEARTVSIPLQTRASPEPEIIAPPPSPSEPVFEPAVNDLIEEKPGRNWLVIAAAVGTLLIIGALYFWLFVADDMTDSPDTNNSKSIEVGQTAEAKQLFVMTEANIRDKATTVGSQILGKMPRGSAVTGVLKLGEDGISEWLELSDGKGFIATVNLGETEPPEIAKTLNDKIWAADGALDIWAQADTSSTLLDRVSEGTKLTLSGLTQNDFIEVKLRKGGVGYIADGASILARLGGRPVAITFNPQTCNFGGELGTEFAKIGTRLRAQWQQLEDTEFVDEEARDKAYAAAEGKSVYVKLPRSFEGLSLTAIAQHYEAQSLYFADPPAKVIDVFREKGFRIGNDGTFPSTELYAGITATRGEGAAYGKSELGCGV